MSLELVNNGKNKNVTNDKSITETWENQKSEEARPKEYHYTGEIEKPPKLIILSNIDNALNYFRKSQHT